MIPKGASGKDAELPINLYRATDGTAITSYVWVTGNVKVALPGAGFGNATVANIVEKGRGKYALRLTSGESATTGGVMLDLDPASINGGDCLAHSWDDVIIDLATSTSLTTAVAKLDLLLGLHRRRTILDGGPGSPNVQLSAAGVMLLGRLRVFGSDAALAAANPGSLDAADGEIARYTITGTDVGGQLGNMEMAVSLEP